jgi:hypothetical protein
MFWSGGHAPRGMFAFVYFVLGATWLAMKVGIASVTPGIFARRAPVIAVVFDAAGLALQRSAVAR